MSFITPENLRAFLVLSVRNADQEGILDAICHASYGMQRTYTDREVLALNPEKGDSGVGSLSTLTDSSKAWPVDTFIGQALIDSAGTVFAITDSDATTVTVSGTPATGAYGIYPLQTELHNVRHILSRYDRGDGGLVGTRYNRAGGTYLRLRSYPIKGVVTVYSDDDSTDALVLNTDYKIYADEGTLHNYAGWRGPEHYWTVKYVGGYVPEDSDWQLLRHWQLCIADAMWNDSGYKRFIVDQFGQAKGSLNYASGTFGRASIYTAINETYGSRFRRITL